MESNAYPQYRKTSNGKNWYKILSDKRFVEIQVIGSKTVEYEITANQYPEMVRIQDMLSCNGYEMANELDFIQFRNSN